MEYPKDWELKELSPEQIGIISPQGWEATITVAAQPMTQAMSMEEYLATQEKNLRAASKEYNRLERETVIFANQHNVTRTIYETVDKVDTNWKSRTLLYTIIREDYSIIYDVSFNATPEHFETMKIQTQEILDTFLFNA